MKLLTLLLFSASLFAQSRVVSLSWTPSTGSAGTVVQTATLASGPWTSIGCVGTVVADTVTGTIPNCVAGSTSLTATYNDSQVVGGTVWYRLIASAAVCTPTTPVGNPCGNSDPSPAISTTIPAKPSSITTVVVVVK